MRIASHLYGVPEHLHRESVSSVLVSIISLIKSFVYLHEKSRLLLIRQVYQAKAISLAIGG